MNTALYKLATRFRNGAWQWPVPGFSNFVRYLPAQHTQDTWGAALYWPSRDETGELIRGADLSQHRRLARAAVQGMLR